jgi:hypothetical protein
VHERVDATRKPPHELAQGDGVNGLLHLLAGRIWAGKRNVVANSPREQERLLRHDAKLPAEGVQRHVPDIVAI